MVRIVPYERYVRITRTLFFGYMKGTLVYHTSGLFYCQLIKPLNVKQIMTCIIKRQSKFIIV